MYKGTLIDELIKIVERAEARARELNQQSELEHWYAKHHQAAQAQNKLLGVA